MQQYKISLDIEEIQSFKWRKATIINFPVEKFYSNVIGHLGLQSNILRNSGR